MQRAGSVRSTIAKLKEITKNENPSNYNEFIRRNQQQQQQQPLIDKV